MSTEPYYRPVSAGPLLANEWVSRAADAGYRFEYELDEEEAESPKLRIKALDAAGARVGYATYGIEPAEKVVKCMNLFVDVPHRKRGVGTAMHLLAEFLRPGHTLEPAAVRTADALALWDRPGRPFGRGLGKQP